MWPVYLVLQENQKQIQKHWTCIEIIMYLNVLYLCIYNLLLYCA